MKYDILNRWTQSIQVTADIRCPDDTADSVKLGLAGKWGLKNGATLTRANLTGAKLPENEQ
jgi:hypothetical protein